MCIRDSKQAACKASRARDKAGQARSASWCGRADMRMVEQWQESRTQGCQAWYMEGASFRLGSPAPV
eukprot:161686-Rhodomonas_salina.1